MYLDGEMMLAPVVKFVDYAALLHRFLVVASDRAYRDDPETMLVVGHFADALHNVPQIMWHHNEGGWYAPSRIDAWLQDYAKALETQEFPEWCRPVFRRDRPAHDLALSPDLSDVDLAPATEIGCYLDALHRALIEMRMIRSYGPRPRESWDRLAEIWGPEAVECGCFNGLLAQALLPLPSGLVHWSQFDEARFREDTMTLAREMPAGYQWYRIFG